MKKSVVLAVGVLGVLSAFAALRSVTPAAREETWWQERHAAKLAEIVANSNRTYGAILIGDAALQQWEVRDKYNWRYWFSNGGKLRSLNLGFEGDRTEHVLWRLANGELENVTAKMVIINLGGDCAAELPFAEEPPADVVLGVKAVLDTVRAKLPKTRVILHAALPAGRTFNDPLRRRIDVANRAIARLCNGYDVIWFDPSQRFLTPDGILPRRLVKPDYRTLTQEAHDIWGGVLVQEVHEMLAPARGPYPKTQDAYASGETDLPRTAIGAPNVTSVVKKREEGPFGDFWWLNRLHNRREQVVALKGKSVDVVFAGDSIMHFWEWRQPASWQALKEKYTALNCGYGGDTTQALLWRLENGELEGYEAKAVVLMIGTNNSTGLEPPEDIAAGIRRCLQTIRAKQPKAKVILHPIFPRGNPDAASRAAHEKPRENNEKVNALIRGFADGKDVLWCDFNAQWTPEGWGVPKELMPDGIHPSAAGYAIWRAALDPILDRVCR